MHTNYLSSRRVHHKWLFFFFYKVHGSWAVLLYRKHNNGTINRQKSLFDFETPHPLLGVLFSSQQQEKESSAIAEKGVTGLSGQQRFGLDNTYTGIHIFWRAWASAYKLFQKLSRVLLDLKKRTKTTTTNQTSEQTVPCGRQAAACFLSLGHFTITPLKQTTNHFPFFTIIMELRQAVPSSIAPRSKHWRALS